MLILALGNHNNLAWFTCYNLAMSLGARVTIFLRSRPKLRDEPLLENGLIQLVRLESDSAETVEDVMQKFLLEQGHALDLCILSGSFINYARAIKRKLPSLKLVYYPIGFELEEFIFDRTPLFLDRFHGMISSVDYVQYQCQYSPALTRVMIESGADKKALPFSRMLHVFRPSFISNCFNQIPPSRSLVDYFDRFSREIPSIFWASRITGEDVIHQSMDNKGLWVFIKALQTLAERCKVKLNLFFIQRCNLSKLSIDRIARLFEGTSISVSRLPELTYPEFCYSLTRVGLAIDTFSPEGGLRANMTSADCISVGARVSASFDETCHARLLEDSELQVFQSKDILGNLGSFLPKTHKESVDLREQRGFYISKQYTEQGEEAESDFFSCLIK